MLTTTDTAARGTTPKSLAKVTREDILVRAEALVPTLRERAEAAEKARMCSLETVQDYTDNGLLRICQPARYGGYELGYDVLCETVQTLARGCGSQAWVHMVLSDNPAKLAAFPLEAQDEVWGENDQARICVAVAAVGKGLECGDELKILLKVAVVPARASKTPVARLEQRSRAIAAGEHAAA